MARTVAVLTPASAELPSTNYPTFAMVNGLPVLAYDATTQETAYWTIACPQGYSSPFTVVPTLIGNAAGTNSTYWEVASDNLS